MTTTNEVTFKELDVLQKRYVVTFRHTEFDAEKNPIKRGISQIEVLAPNVQTVVSTVAKHYEEAEVLECKLKPKNHREALPGKEIIA